MCCVHSRVKKVDRGGTAFETGWWRDGATPRCGRATVRSYSGAVRPNGHGGASHLRRGDAPGAALGHGMSKRRRRRLLSAHAAGRAGAQRHISVRGPDVQVGALARLAHLLWHSRFTSHAPQLILRTVASIPDRAGISRFLAALSGGLEHDRCCTRRVRHPSHPTRLLRSTRTASPHLHNSLCFETAAAGAGCPRCTHRVRVNQFQRTHSVSAGLATTVGRALPKGFCSEPPTPHPCVCAVYVHALHCTTESYLRYVSTYIQCCDATAVSPPNRYPSLTRLLPPRPLS